MAAIYSTPAWAAARAAVLERDRHRCTVARLLGGTCAELPLHVHHLIPADECVDPFDVDNLITTCASHHPRLEALRRAILRERERPRCPHVHPYVEGRLLCEARLSAAMN
jgi:5-methylcytosine-specific restriction endonuclease McrA